MKDLKLLFEETLDLDEKTYFKKGDRIMYVLDDVARAIPERKSMMTPVTSSRIPATITLSSPISMARSLRCPPNLQSLMAVPVPMARHLNRNQ